MDEQQEKMKSEKECEKCQEYLNGWKRALADYDNLKKELAKERQSSRESGMEETSLIAIEAFDDLKKAFQLEEKGEQWVSGIGHIKDLIEGRLEQKGFCRIQVEPGQTFDPYLHHAVAERTEPEHVASGSILEVLQDGWKKNDKIIRPAMVIVAK